MKTTATQGTVDYRLLGLLSDLVICSRCLSKGRSPRFRRSCRTGIRRERFVAAASRRAVVTCDVY